MGEWAARGKQPLPLHTPTRADPASRLRIPNSELQACESARQPGLEVGLEGSQGADPTTAQNSRPRPVKALSCVGPSKVPPMNQAWKLRGRGAVGPSGLPLFC